MPPKKLSSLKSMSMSSTGSKFKTNHIDDLVTNQQAALSSQASVNNSQRTLLTQRTFGTNNGGQMDQMQFNRDELGEQVFITQQQQTMIQRILQISRKGKINQKNAFEIPLKVMPTQNTQSATNKFWKFASQLLGASMSIYDKRVQNMYISTHSMTSKLTIIDVDIKSRSNDSIDDVHQDEDRRKRNQIKERQQILSISIQQFSGALQPDSLQQGIGYSTLQQKKKIDIVNVDSKFLANPAFNRTQKMFDSYSLKSLMMNIFSLNCQQQIQLYDKSLQQIEINKNHKIKKYQQIKKQRSTQDDQIRIDDEVFSRQDKQIYNAKNTFNLQKHFDECRKILNESGFLSNISKYLLDIPELNVQNSNESRIQRQQQGYEQISFGDKVQKQKQKFIEMFKQIQNNYNQQTGIYQFDQLPNDGLFQTSQTYSQSITGFQDQNSSIDNNYGNQSNSMPLYYTNSFFEFDEKKGKYQPLMPYQIQFKNQKLLINKKGRRQGRNHRQRRQVIVNGINFSQPIQLLQRDQVLKSHLTKANFNRQTQRSNPTKIKQKNIVVGELEVYTDHHMQFNRNVNKSSRKSQKLDSQLKKEQHYESFILDVDHNAENHHKDIEDFRQQQTFLQQNGSIHERPIQQSSDLIDHLNTGDTIFYGRNMGINNIRQIKKFIQNEVLQKGQTSISQISKILPLSYQQIFTVFLHLINQNTFNVDHNDDQDQTDVRLSVIKLNEQIQI